MAHSGEFGDFLGIGTLALVLLAIISLFVYFLPSIIAAKRRHHNAKAIATLNLLLGWTVLGWIGSLAWSFTETYPKHRKRSGDRQSNQEALNDETSPARPWYEDQVLEDFVIKIPGMTQNIIWVARRALHDVTLNGFLQVKDGCWVRAGDILSKYSGFSVIAPVSGRVVATGSDSTSWSKGQPILITNDTPGMNDHRNYFFQIQPIKGATTDNVMERTYGQVISLVQKVFDKPRKHRKIISDYTQENVDENSYPSMPDRDKEMTRNRQDLQMFRQFVPVMEPITPRVLSSKSGN